MKKNKSFLLFAVLATLISSVLTDCKYDKGTPDYNGYPNDVGKIIVNKCATSGCHNDLSKDGSGGLSMQSWDKMFEGGNNSASVIPYRHDFSTTCYVINTYPDLGVSLVPTMPYNKTPLSHDDVKLIENWVDAGAPNSAGFVKFSDNPQRKKFYVANQGCDVVTVFDEQTLLPMRYISIGNSPSIEAAHDIQVSPDGQYWYVVFYKGNSIQKYRTSDDSYVGQAILNVNQPPVIINGNWSTFAMTSDGSTAFITDLSSPGYIAEVNLNNLTVTHHGGFNSPHGSAVSPDGNFLYVTEQYGSSKIYKIPVTDFSAYTEVNLYTSQPAVYLNTHQVEFSPDGTEYFVTCSGTSEVRVMQTSNDAFITSIPVGGYPAEMDVSSTKNLLFVTCEEDTLSFPGKRGSVAVIDMTTNSQVSWSPIYTGHQPHGISVDDVNNLVYVANRNAVTGGPAPHHTSVCGGKDGYITFIDMNAHALVKTKTGTVKSIEVAVDPYEVALRH